MKVQAHTQIQTQTHWRNETDSNRTVNAKTILQTIISRVKKNF